MATRRVRRELTVERIVVMQAMFAAKNMRGQRDRLLEFQVQLQHTPGDYSIEEVISGLDEVRVDGLMVAARYLVVCLDKAAEYGARLAPSPSFSNYRQLIDALKAAKRLPARPTTQTEAYSRIQTALYAVKLLQEHVLPCCIDHLKKFSTATVQATGSSSSSIEEICSLFDRTCTIVVNLAIEHIDLAVSAISRFVHAKEVASNSRFADRYTNFGWSMEDLKLKRFLRGWNEADVLGANKP